MPRTRPEPPTRPKFSLLLVCSCGTTLRGLISVPFRDAIALRDLFLSFHRQPGCTVTDLSEG